jgi:hypothetical protein
MNDHLENNIISSNILNRQQLYDSVWAEPIRTIARRYGLPDRELRKICKDMNIPVPQMGHWQKIRYGKKVEQIPLPSDYLGNEQAILRPNVGRSQSGTINTPQVPTPQQQIEAAIPLQLKVANRLTNPDPLVVAAQNSLTEKDRWLHNGLINTRSGILDIKVSPANISRALRFMDAFVKSVKARGHTIKFIDKDTFVDVRDLKLRIAFREKLKKEIVKDKSWPEYHPTGILYFKVDGYHSAEYKDGKLNLEDKISRAIALMEQTSNEINLIWEKSRKQEEERKAIKQAELKIQQLKQQELDAFKKLIKSAHRWREVKILRQYVEEIAANKINNGEISEEFNKWLAWARHKIDWYDPEMEAEDELLKEVDRELLEFRMIRS